MRKKIVNLLLSAALLVAMTAGPAAALTFYLDENIGGGPPVTSIPSFGTITLTQAGNGVQIDVLLNDNTQKLLEFALNYNDAKFSNADKFSLSNGVSVNNQQDGIQQDGYKGMLDIAIPGNSNLKNGSTFSAILSDSKGTLTPDDFNFMDTLSYAYCAAHIGSLADGSSIWAGSDGNTPTDPVPEPGTMMLLGAGFLGLAVYGKRRKNA